MSYPTLYAYSFWHISGIDSEWFYPEFEIVLVYAKSKEQARDFIKDEGSFELRGNIRGVAYGEEGYENGYIEIIVDSSIQFYRNIKKIGRAPEGASIGIINLKSADEEDIEDK